MMNNGITTLPSVVQRRWLPALAVFVSTIAGGILYTTTTPRLYETKSRILLDDRSVSVSELGNALTKPPENVAGGPSPVATQAELVRSQRLLQKAVDQLLSSGVIPTAERDAWKAKLTPEAINKNLTVTIIPATNILQLTYRSSDPDISYRLLNVISGTMVQDNAEFIRQKASSVRLFLERNVPLQQAKLEAAEAAENQYRQNSGIVSADEQTRKLVESVANLSDQERGLIAQLREAQVRENSLRQITDVTTLQNAYAAVRIGQDTELKQLREQLANLEAKVIEESSRLGDQHPDLLALIEQRDASRQLYNQKVAQLLTPKQSRPPNSLVASDTLSQELISKLIVGEVERHALNQHLAVIQSERGRLQSLLSQFPIRLQPLANLVRQREEAAATLKLLQSKLEEARIAEAQMVSNLRVIELAQKPDSAKWPSRSVVLVLAATFGVVFSTIVVLLLELTDYTLHDANEAEGLLQVPLLGEVPDLPITGLQPEASERFLDVTTLVEPYRMLLNTLEIRGQNRVQKVLLSSTSSGEGTSTVAAHLAAVSALLFRKTLLIDANPWQPNQYHLFRLPQQPGLAEVIQGKRALQDAVQTTSIENLFVLASGQTTTRPAQVLESGSMQDLLVEASQHFDLIIVDAASFSTSSDVLTLGGHCDGFLLVTRPGLTSKHRLKQLATTLTRNHLPIMGFISNQASSSAITPSYDPPSPWQPHTPSSTVSPQPGSLRKLAIMLRSMI